MPDTSILLILSSFSILLDYIADGRSLCISVMLRYYYHNTSFLSYLHPRNKIAFLALILAKVYLRDMGSKKEDLEKHVALVSRTAFKKSN